MLEKLDGVWGLDYCKFPFYTTALQILGMSLLDTYIHYRQWKYVNHLTEEPTELRNVNSSAYKTIRAITLRDLQFMIMECLIKAATAATKLYLKFPKKLWDYVVENCKKEHFQPVAFLFAEILLEDFINLPAQLAFFFSEVKENRIVTSFKVIMKWMFSTSLHIISAHYVIRLMDLFGANFFFVPWIFVVLETIFLIPIIEKTLTFHTDFSPLTSGPLYRKLNRLASDTEFPLTRIYLTQDLYVNMDELVYYSGILGENAIIISMKLIDTRSEEEIAAIIAHELGHWKHNHLNYYLACSSLYFLTLRLLLGSFYNSKILWRIFSIKKPQPALSIILILRYLTPPVDRLLTTVHNRISHLCEFQADNFAKQMGYKQALQSALKKDYLDDFEFPEFDLLYASLYSSRPSIQQRLLALRS